MINIKRFDKNKASAAHGGTILASPVVPGDVYTPFSHAYGFLDKDGASMEKHSHPTYEFYIVTEGNGFVEVDGERAPVSVGDVIEIPPDSVHSMICSGNSPFVWMAFWWTLPEKVK